MENTTHTPPTNPPASPSDWTRSLAGSAVGPLDPDWDAARTFHEGIGEPDLVVRAESVDDVRAAVRYAASMGAPVLVRSGGHGPWGEIPGGVVVDLRALRSVEVDTPTRLVSVGGGALWGEIAQTLAAHGLALSSGDTASVGVGGLTLGGGVGWMVRAWGLTIDQLVGAQVVTATGDVVEASATQHPDLFWALRGGGGNFGVVTRFDFVAHPLESLVFTTLAGGDTATVLRTLRDVMRDAPRELTVTYMNVPSIDPKASLGGLVMAAWIGDDPEAPRGVLAPLLAVEGVTELESGVRAYGDILVQKPAYDPNNPAPEHVGANTLLRELDGDTIDRLATFHAARPTAVLLLRSLGGAYADVAADATAFTTRDATWFALAGVFRVPGLLDADDEPEVLSEIAAIEDAGVGRYGNFRMSAHDPEWVSRMYPAETFRRLAKVKHEWDPHNLFSRNNNILPAG